MLAKALETATPTLRDVAQWAKLAYGTVRAYRLGSRTAPPEATRAIARALRAHAKGLLEAADRLDSEAERKP